MAYKFRGFRENEDILEEEENYDVETEEIEDDEVEADEYDDETLDDNNGEEDREPLADETMEESLEETDEEIENAEVEAELEEEAEEAYDEIVEEVEISPTNGDPHDEISVIFEENDKELDYIQEELRDEHGEFTAMMSQPKVTLPDDDGGYEAEIVDPVDDLEGAPSILNNMDPEEFLDNSDSDDDYEDEYEDEPLDGEDYDSDSEEEEDEMNPGGIYDL